ncbi:MAG TPA: class II glutamine amidotransferase [Pirellulales bacterium]|nr:class II glutamine amidotransferase [Pirellulales bacterium]
MCRLFAFRSTVPICDSTLLNGSGNSLATQSRRDAHGESHIDGWGLASYADDGVPHITKSLLPAFSDPQFGEVSRTVTTKTLVAHVRQASVGSAALVNTHPFIYERWVFVHNGTLQDFAARRKPLFDAIPYDLRTMIRGETDSECVFFFWLSRLRAAVGSINQTICVETVITAFQETVNLVDSWFPAHHGEESKFNFVATNGRIMAATRWGKSLSYLERLSGGEMSEKDGHPNAINAFRSVHISSEATDGNNWREVSDRSMIVVDEQLDVHAASLL